jgi:hypothetical protein
MNRTGLLLVSAVLGLTGCGGQSAGPDGRDFPHVIEAIDRHAPTPEELTSIRYQGLAAGAVTLQGGAWRGAAVAGAEAPTVALLKDPQLAGDITGNGTNEAVVLLQERRPGLPPQLYVAIVASVEGRATNVATALLGSDVLVAGGRADLGRFVLDVVRPAPAPAARLTYTFKDNVLRLIGETPIAAGSTP